MRLAFLLTLLLGAAGCSSTDDDAAGTTNPDVTTPAEMPADSPALEVDTASVQPL